MSQSRNNDKESKTVLVTSALPYANGDIHLGHIVEAVQTDVYVRFRRLIGDKAVYVCADDTHGTPIQLNAMKLGITPEELVARAWERHVADYAAYGISFDIFSSTNTAENREYAEAIYARLTKAGLVVEKEIMQYYCEHDKRFLPDRFIIGTCPKCKATDQYGDVCEVCGTTYDSVDMGDPKCAICKNTPVLKSSRHLFVQLASSEPFLREYLLSSDVLTKEMKNYVKTWLDEGIREWCISRDGPYFGFRIPGTEDKYFYVWLDAPIAYIASTAQWCAGHNEKLSTFWGADTGGELVHFIGKDIVRFHTLFWPVELKTAGYRLPSKIVIHGFLTLGGEKMSKSRGTFILARDFKEKVALPNATQYLRFFFASKMSNSAGDIDLNFDELITKVNTTLANNIGNLCNRTFVFCTRYFNGNVPVAAWNTDIQETVAAAAKAIAGDYASIDTKSVVERIHALGNAGNKYFQDSKPWELIKNQPEKAAEVMVTCANLVKALAVFLKPIVPNIVEDIEKQLGYNPSENGLTWNDYEFSLGKTETKLGETKPLVTPLVLGDFAALLAPAVQAEPVPEVTEVPIKPLIDFEQFLKIDLRTATILEAEKLKKSEKLIKLKVQIGSQTRQIVAGIGKHYEAATLVGKQIIVVANLKPAKLMGELSEGMLLAGKDGDVLALLTPEKPVRTGTVVS